MPLTLTWETRNVRWSQAFVVVFLLALMGDLIAKAKGCPGYPEQEAM